MFLAGGPSESPAAAALTLGLVLPLLFPAAFSLLGCRLFLQLPRAAVLGGLELCWGGWVPPPLCAGLGGF